MGELIATFHIDWKLLVAQLINFLIVLFVLWRFALKPLLAVMQERADTIDRSLRQAKEIEEKLQRTEEETQQKIRDAHKQAIAMQLQATKQGDEKKREIIADAHREAGQILTQVKDQVRQEKESMLMKARGEIATLVTSGIEKVLGDVVDEKLDCKIIEQRLRSIHNVK